MSSGVGRFDALGPAPADWFLALPAGLANTHDTGRAGGLVRVCLTATKVHMMRIVLLACLVLSCCGVGVCVAADNELTPEEKAAGWQLLFNGRDLTGWKCNNDRPIATQIEDGCLVPFKSGGYLIIHEKPFGDFILKCDVRWEDPRCNSGIFFRVEDPRNPVHTGFEAQVMAGDGTGKHALGAIYDLAGTTESPARADGEWNQVEIKCQGPHVSVQVNGQPAAQLNCDEFDQPGVCPDGKPHKFKLGGKGRAVKDFARTGYLGFQDHGHKVWYKNVKLLELKD